MYRKGEEGILWRGGGLFEKGEGGFGEGEGGYVGRGGGAFGNGKGCRDFEMGKKIFGKRKGKGYAREIWGRVKGYFKEIMGV